MNNVLNFQTVLAFCNVRYFKNKWRSHPAGLHQLQRSLQLLKRKNQKTISQCTFLYRPLENTWGQHRAENLVVALNGASVQPARSLMGSLFWLSGTYTGIMILIIRKEWQICNYCLILLHATYLLPTCLLQTLMAKKWNKKSSDTLKEWDECCPRVFCNSVFYQCYLNYHSTFTFTYIQFRAEKKCIYFGKEH